MRTSQYKMLCMVFSVVLLVATVLLHGISSGITHSNGVIIHGISSGVTRRSGVITWYFQLHYS